MVQSAKDAMRKLGSPPMQTEGVDWSLANRPIRSAVLLDVGDKRKGPEVRWMVMTVWVFIAAMKDVQTQPAPRDAGQIRPAVPPDRVDHRFADHAATPTMEGTSGPNTTRLSAAAAFGRMR